MNVYAIWLEWPEECFRLSPGNLKTFRSLAPRESRIIRAKNEKEFVSALSSATHAITWSFKREWYAKAPRLKAVATPAAGRELVALAEDRLRAVMREVGGRAAYLECEEEPDLLGLRIAVDGSHLDEDFQVGVYVTLEALLGEFDCATLLGYVETVPLPAEPFKSGFQQLDDLPKFVEWFKHKRDE